MINSITCRVDFNIDDTPPSLVAFLRRIEPFLIAIDSPSFWLPTLDLSMCQFMGPSATTLIASLVLEARLQRRPVKVIPPVGPHKLLAFLNYNGFDALLGNGGPPDCSSPLCETVPIMNLRGGQRGEAEDILKLVRRHTHVTEENAEYLRIGFNEMVQNVVDHSKSKIGCVASAKFNSFKGTVTIAVIDRGLGVLKTLQTRYPDLNTSRRVLQSVIDGGFSSKSRTSNAGLGISNLAHFVRNLYGRLWIISGSAWIAVDASKPTESGEPRDWSFKGTAVFFTLRVATPIPRNAR